jgi:hypothetical protein
MKPEKLKQYNQKMQAILLTLLVILAGLGILFLIAFFIVSIVG